MPKYKMVALDIDGTILTDDKQITQKTRYWIQEAVDAGVTVIFATGRGIQRTEELWDDLGLDGPMVMVNGAEIWKSRGELLERTFIGRDHIYELHRLAVENNARFWGYSVESLTNQSHWTDEMFERDWLKFGIRHDDLDTIKRMREEVRRWGNLEVTRSAPVNMEISAKGISKAYGVQKVCDLLQIPMEDVMAIGDDLNDSHLIKTVGLGVAMGNADETLKEAADKITDTNSHDGVAKAIEDNLFID